MFEGKKSLVIFLVIILVAVIVAFALLKKKGEAPMETQAPTEQPMGQVTTPEMSAEDTGGSPETMAPLQPDEAGTAVEPSSPSAAEETPPAETEELEEELEEEIPSP